MSFLLHLEILHYSFHLNIFFKVSSDATPLLKTVDCL